MGALLGMPQNRHKNTAFRGPSTDVGKRTRFVRGRSGNPGGRPKKKPITDIFQRIFENPENVEEIETVVMRILRRRDMASVLMLKLMADRLEGKVMRSIYFSGALELSDLSDEELQFRLDALSNPREARLRTA
jgi:hypothetical protein